MVDHKIVTQTRTLYGCAILIGQKTATPLKPYDMDACALLGMGRDDGAFLRTTRLATHPRSAWNDGYVHHHVSAHLRGHAH